MSFVDNTHGWVVGPSNLIAATTDGGKTWTTQVPAMADRNLDDVDFVNRTQGWAVGSLGFTADAPYVVATTDGGRTWRSQTLPVGKGWKVNGVDFVDGANGFAVGYRIGSDEGLILATTDGGATWSRQDCTACQQMAGVSFVDGLHGWAVGARGTIRATSDGGISWSPQPVPDAWGSYGIGDVVALSWDRAVAAGFGSNILVLAPPAGSASEAPIGSSAGRPLAVPGIL